MSLEEAQGETPFLCSSLCAHYSSIPIRAITARHSLSPSSFTCCPIGLPCDSRSLNPLAYGQGGQQAYHVPPMYPRGEAASLRRWLDICAGGVRGLRTWPLTFWSKRFSSLRLSFVTTPTMLYLGWPSHAILVPDHPCCWQSQLRLAPGLPSLQRRLRCPGAYYPGKILLAEQQVWSVLSEYLHTATSATSCRTRTTKLTRRGRW
jgi:hypothetical protein